MLFAQFLHKSAIGPELIEASGDRSVVILDGRYSNASNNDIARQECIKRGYLAYSIYKGESFTRCVRVSGPWYPTNSREDKSAMSATHGM